VLALERGEAGLEVLLDREQREDLAALRHQRDAAARALVEARFSHIHSIDRLLHGSHMNAGQPP